MGKCLSCFKPQHVSSICVNESNNTLDCKSNEPDCNVTELELQKHSKHRTQSGVSHLNVMNGLHRDVHVNGSTEEIITIEEHSKKLSFTTKSKHFSPFFQAKVLGTGENDNKAKQRNDVWFESKVNTLFEKYKDADERDMILMEGVEKLCNDLNLQPDDFKILILAWKFNAEQMCQFTRQEFINGCKEMRAENLSQIQSKLSEIATLLKHDQLQFKNLYRFTFKFGLDRTVGQRILPIDIADSLWKLVFTLHEPPILERWLLFLQSDQAHIRGIPRDTWNMFLNFSETIGNDLSSYDDAEAWPSIFDDFVEYEKARLNQNVILPDSSTYQIDSCSEKPKESTKMNVR